MYQPAEGSSASLRVSYVSCAAMLVRSPSATTGWDRHSRPLSSRDHGLPAGIEVCVSSRSSSTALSGWPRGAMRRYAARPERS